MSIVMITGLDGTDGMRGDDSYHDLHGGFWTSIGFLRK